MAASYSCAAIDYEVKHAPSAIDYRILQTVSCCCLCDKAMAITRIDLSANKKIFENEHRLAKPGSCASIVLKLSHVRCCDVTSFVVGHANDTWARSSRKQLIK